MSRNYLNKDELAAFLGMNVGGVEELMRTRRIPYITLGHRTVRFYLPAVENALLRFERKAVGQEAR